MRRRLLALSVVMALFAIPQVATAQDVAVRPYETEDDLWEAWQEGEIDFETYVFLLELVRTGLDAPDYAPEDLEALPGNAGQLPITDTTLWDQEQLFSEAPAKATKARWHVSQRGGYDSDLGNDVAPGDGYTIWKITGPNVRAVAHLKSGAGGTRVYSRSARIDLGRWRVTLGDFAPRFGRGLVVGRRDRFIGARSIDRPDGSLAYPEGSRFNGAVVNGTIAKRFDVAAMQSVIQSDEWQDNASAASVALKWKSLTIGGAFLHGSIESRSDSTNPALERDIYSVFSSGTFGRQRWIAELALDENGVGARAAEVTHSAKDWTVAARLWNFEPAFINPWGGGPSLSDRTSIPLDELDEEYSSRTSGERGFSLLTRSRIAQNARLELAWALARTEPADTRSSEWKAQALWQIRDGWKLRPYLRGQTEDDEPSSIRTGSYVDGRINDDFRFRVHGEFGRYGDDDRASAWASAEFWWQINPTIGIHPAVRMVDRNLDLSHDAYYYLYLTETITLAPNYNLTVTLRSKRFEDSLLNSETEIRVRGKFATGF